MIKNNKRGDIATLILVVGVFLVCAVMIFSFTFFNASNKGKFTNVLEIMARANSMGEQVRFYENAGQNPLEFLDVTKKGNEYNITLNEIDDGERIFGVQYLFKEKAQSQQPSQ